MRYLIHSCDQDIVIEADNITFKADQLIFIKEHPDYERGKPVASFRECDFWLELTAEKECEKKIDEGMKAFLQGFAYKAPKKEGWHSKCSAPSDRRILALHRDSGEYDIIDFSHARNAWISADGDFIPHEEAAFLWMDLPEGPSGE